MGVNRSATPSGCCGMAGAFGFEAEKYELSLKIAKRSLFPAVRAHPADGVILANGFSCREQIEQGTGRRTLHIAELLAESMGLAA
jgi:Fe-S oxidoreductase